MASEIKDPYSHIKNRVKEIEGIVNTCDMPRIVEEIRSLSDYTGRMVGFGNITLYTHGELSREIKHLSDKIREECTCNKKIWGKQK
jgi:hypothetical protein